MSSSRRTVQAWEAEIQLPVTITEEGMQYLKDELWVSADRAVNSAARNPFVWHIQGALCTIRTQESPIRLIHLAEILFDGLPDAPEGFSVSSIRTEPIKVTTWWTGRAPE